MFLASESSVPRNEGTRLWVLVPCSLVLPWKMNAAFISTNVCPVHLQVKSHP